MLLWPCPKPRNGCQHLFHFFFSARCFPSETKRTAHRPRKMRLIACSPRKNSKLQKWSCNQISIPPPRAQAAPVLPHTPVLFKRIVASDRNASSIRFFNHNLIPPHTKARQSSRPLRSIAAHAQRRKQKQRKEGICQSWRKTARPQALASHGNDSSQHLATSFLISTRRLS